MYLLKRRTFFFRMFKGNVYSAFLFYDSIAFFGWIGYFKITEGFLLGGK